MYERTFVGLDVHARSVVACGIDTVTVPSVQAEAARDLVRAREDCRGDLMSARHRLSKLLLRQGVIWSGGATWTGARTRQDFCVSGFGLMVS